MLNQESIDKTDNRCFFEILKTMKRLQKEMIDQNAEQEKNCNLCNPELKCFWHISGYEKIQYWKKKEAENART